MPVVDPTTGRTVAEVPVADRDTVDRAVRTAVDAARSWRKLAPSQRRDYLRRLGAAVTADRDRLATLDAYDSGNPRRAMLADADHGVHALEYFAGISPELHGATVPASASGLHFSLLEPYGVVVRIIPFNHPLMFCLLHSAAPLAAGNVVILKAPDQTPLAPLEFARIAAEVLPPGVVTVLTGPGPVTGDALVRHPEVRRIAFTGRRETGLRVMSAAADSGVVKNITLELGGKNPLIRVARRHAGGSRERRRPRDEPADLAGTIVRLHVAASTSMKISSGRPPRRSPRSSKRCESATRSMKRLTWGRSSPPSSSRARRVVRAGRERGCAPRYGRRPAEREPGSRRLLPGADDVRSGRRRVEARRAKRSSGRCCLSSRGASATSCSGA